MNLEAIFDKGVKVFVFKAPVGDRRNLVKEKMLEMASVEWTPDRDFTTCWKGVSEVPVGLDYKKGEIYRGVTYSKAHGDLYEFLSFLEKRGGVPVFVPNSPYYENEFREDMVEQGIPVDTPLPPKEEAAPEPA